MTLRRATEVAGHGIQICARYLLALGLFILPGLFP